MWCATKALSWGTRKFGVCLGLCFCLSILGPLHAQQYRFRNYTGDDGLSQLVAQTIFQDRQGYIWIGTQAGLNCFDGEEFEVFSVRHGLRNDWINVIGQDSTGKIWVGTNDGLSSWTHRGSHNFTTAEGLPSNQVLTLIVDGENRIWCGTSLGLARKDGERFEAFLSEESGLPPTAVRTLLLGKEGTLLVGTDAGLFEYVHNKFKRRLALSDPVVGLALDEKGRLWVATRRAVYVYSDRRLVRRFTPKSGLSPGTVNTLAYSSDGTLWVGTSQGLTMIREGRVQRISRANGLHLYDVRAVVADREGIIWVGGVGGVSKFLGRAFTNYTTEDGLGSNSVRPILRSHDGYLWVGTMGGLSRYDGKRWRNFTRADGLSDPQIWSLYEDRAGKLWIGTTAGLNYYAGRRFHQLSQFPVRGVVVSIVADPRDHLWIAVRGTGVFRQTRGGFAKIQVPGQTFLDARLLVDRLGRVWVSGEHGLSCWDGRAWRTFTTKDGLATNHPYYLCEDKKGCLWFGYHSSHGLTCYDGKRFTTYTTADGLYNDAVYSIGVDRKNNLWIGTARGVDRFDGKTFINYGTVEGYASQESNAGGFFADRDGTLWFGTMEGLSHYNPRFDLAKTPPPAIKIHSVSFGHKPIHGFKQGLRVPYKRNDLKVRIATFSYINRKHLHLRYRLLGHDETWRPLEGATLSFTNLPPGRYKLQVQGRKYRGVWSAPVEVEFEIAPPFWQTAWFDFLVVLILTLAFAGLSRYRVGKVKKRNQILKEKIDQHTRELKEQNEKLETLLAERKQAEEALRESRRRLNNVINSAPVILFALNREGRFTLSEGNGLSSLGLKTNDVVGLSVYELYRDEPKLLKDIERAFAGETFDSTVSVQGSVFQVHYSPVINGDDEVGGIMGVAYDITRQIRAEERIASSERKFRAVFENANDAIFLMDHAAFVDCNPRTEQMFGCTRDQILNMRPHDFSPPTQPDGGNSREKAMEKIAAAWSGQPQVFEWKHRRIDGTLFDAEVSLNLIEVDGRKMIQAMVRDITERKESERQLQVQKAYLEQLFESAPEAIAVLDKDDRVVRLNKEFTNMFGYTEAEAGGRPINDLIVPEEFQEESRSLSSKVTEGHQVACESIRRRKDGSMLHVSILGTPIMVDGGQVAIYGIYRDITDRKRTEEELRKLSLAIQQSPSSVLITDIEGRIEYVNPKFTAVTGYTAAEVRGRKPNILKSGFHPPEFYRDLWKTISAGKEWRGEFCNKKKNGEIYWEYASISAMRDEKGQITHYVAVKEDVTERKLAVVEMEKAKEAAESANRALRKTNRELKHAMALAQELAKKADEANTAKSEFLANMSHEIRTPLNAIIGMTELVLDTKLSEEQQEYLNTVQSSSESLLNLINDILDFSKIEAGQIEIEQIRFNLVRTVEKVADIMRVRARKKHLELACFVDPETHPWVVGDPTRIHQILLNLVGNAVKFTDHGEVTIEVRPAETPCRQQHSCLLFSVADSGVGIAKENIDKIFDKFSQEDSSITRKFGGTGLGLSISKSLVELMGGEIWVESEAGKGTKFYFTLSLPTAEPDSSQPITGVELTGDGRGVLVVDDNATSRTILQKTLVAWGFKVHLAENARRGLHLLERMKEAIQVVVLDHEMPDMDGLEAARAIRSNPVYRDLKLILLSSWGANAQEELQQLGIARAITKPVLQSRLQEILKEIIGLQSESGAHEPGAVPETPLLPPSGRILLVDDVKENLVLAERILTREGYDVDVAYDGHAAVESARQVSYDLIFMDIQMPGMDGFQTTEVIRGVEKEVGRERTPIIALTAHALRGYREKCLAIGMDDYLAKPIKKRLLLNMVQKWLDPRPRILVVDDSPDNRSLLLNHLAREGVYRIVSAQNGKEAVEKIDRENVSLVLMDMEMPVMSGYEASSAIRKSEHGKDLPIIALTAHQGKEEVERCLGAGCTDYLPKPVRKKQLLEVVHRYLGVRRS